MNSRHANNTIAKKQTRPAINVCTDGDADFMKGKRARTSRGTPQRSAAMRPPVSALKGSGEGVSSNGAKRNDTAILIAIFLLIVPAFVLVAGIEPP